MPATFGKYQIQREIGRGAMGIVYEARDPSLNRDIALKVLTLPGDAPDGSRVDALWRQRSSERFIREGRALANLSHPNIVAVLDMGEVEGRCYLAMELVRGTTLGDRIRFHGALPIGEVVRVGIAVCQALDHMHGRGLVHRDLKPDNIMLLPDGRVKVTDFGVALALADAAPSPSGQGPRAGGLPASMHGSPAYMSPEQVLGKQVDGRSDLFSLGVTLYEAATGRRPFQADTLTALVHQVAHEAAAPAPILPPFLHGILARAMEKEPERRYRDANQLAADLQSQRAPLAAPSDFARASLLNPAGLAPPPRPASPFTPSAPPGGPPWASPPGPGASPWGAPPTAGLPYADPQPGRPGAAQVPSIWDPQIGARSSPLARAPEPWGSPLPGAAVPPYPASPNAELNAVFCNTSGMGSKAPVPAEIANGWNWGAFLLPLFWGVAHNTWLALLCLSALICLPLGAVVNPIVSIVFGISGNQYAWQNRRWESVEQFRAVQRAWAAWGLAVFVSSCFLACLFFLFMLRHSS